jgi:hypothetical protein
MPNVNVNLNVTVEASGNISVFGEAKPTMGDIVVCSRTIPITCLYNGTDNSLIRFQDRIIDNVNTIYGERNTSFTTAKSQLESNLKSVINSSVTCSNAYPFTTYSSEYKTYSSFGNLCLAAYSHSLFGHVAATAAIDNDTDFISKMNNDQGNLDAKLNKALAEAIYLLPADKATYIAKQVIGQDSTRAKFEDNSSSDWQALEFKNGDIIYVSITLLPPNITTATGQQNIPSSSSHSTTTYALEITLWDGIGTKPVNSNGSSGSGSTNIGGNTFVLISYTPTSSYLAINSSASITPTLIGAPNSFSISPNLPAGLNFNNTNGIISGTPTAFTPLTEYTVSATNTTSSATNTTTITFATVSSTANFNYDPIAEFGGEGEGLPTFYITVNSTTSYTPQGDMLTNYLISPNLPSGCSLNSTTGELTFAPTASFSRTTYTITATNGIATPSITFDIVINAELTNINYTSTAQVSFGKNIYNTITPTMTGPSLTSISTTPDLPLGLSISLNGTISGTTSSTFNDWLTINYTNSAGGSGTTDIFLRIISGAPNISYSSDTFMLKINDTVSITPVNTGGYITSYTVSPSLPTSIDLNGLNGVIYKTRSVLIPSAPTYYTVTGTNMFGSSSAILNIGIFDEPTSAPQIGYYDNTIHVNKNTLQTISAVNMGGNGIWSVSPAFPSSVKFNRLTGEIKLLGTTTNYGPVSHMITATNSIGSAQAAISLHLAPQGVYD